MLLGGYNHGHYGNLPHPVATEMAFGYRINAERMYQVGFVNRLVEQENLMEEAHSMAKHLLSLPPASRVNTLYMMKHMAPKLPSNMMFSLVRIPTPRECFAPGFLITTVP